VRLVRRCVDAVRQTRTRVIVNDRLDVALAANAHGLHLRSDSFPSVRARRLAERGFIIGRSIHTVDEASQASADGSLDYLMFGTVFPSVGKPAHPPAGVGALVSAAAATTLPVLAIGGITARTVGQLGTTGAAGFAAIGLFAEADDESLRGVLSMEW
jgi:thiamine-phosphate diphosphorylase